MAYQYLAVLTVSALSNLANVFSEVLIDTTTDFVLDKANETFEKIIPSLSDDEYFNQFTNQVRSGIAASTQAKIMSKAMQGQSKIEDKIEKMKAKVDEQYQLKSTQIKKMKRKGTKGKRLTSLKEQYNHEIKQIEDDGKRIYQMKDTGSKEAHAYSNGLGSLKGANDGTIQNLKPTPTAELSATIKDLLNSQNHFIDKSGVDQL